MKANIKLIILTISLLGIVSCKKEKIDNTITNVGFYFEDKDAKSNEPKTLNLFIDEVYKGKIYILNEEPSNKNLLLFCELDSKKHDIDIKDESGKFIAAHGFQISKSSSYLGSGKNSNKISGPLGAKNHQKQGEDYHIFASFINF